MAGIGEGDLKGMPPLPQVFVKYATFCTGSTHKPSPTVSGQKLLPAGVVYAD